MLRLSRLLADYIRDEFLAGVAEQNQNTLRVYFAGAPVKYLNEVFDSLSNFDAGLKVEKEGNCENVFIFQVDERHTIPVSPGRACKGSESGFINLRNNNSIQYCVILNSHSSQIQSLGSAVRPIGITGRVRSAADWLQTPLLQRLLQQIFSITKEIIAEARLREAIEFSLEKAWIADEHQQNHDRQNCWSLFERMLQAVSEEKISLTSISMALGLFSCPEQILAGKVIWKL